MCIKKKSDKGKNTSLPLLANLCVSPSELGNKEKTQVLSGHRFYLSLQMKGMKGETK